MAISSFLLDVEQNNLVLSRFHSSDDISSSDSQLKIFSTCTVVVFFLLRHDEKRKTIDPEKNNWLLRDVFYLHLRTSSISLIFCSADDFLTSLRRSALIDKHEQHKWFLLSLLRSQSHRCQSNVRRRRRWSTLSSMEYTIYLGLVERLTIYLTFILSVVGIIGNAGTILVLNQQTMRKWRSSILLSALAIVDFLYLSIIFPFDHRSTDRSIDWFSSLVDSLPEHGVHHPHLF